MNKKEFNAFVHAKFSEILDTNKSGQSEYALSENAFDNFDRLAAELGVDRKQVLLVYFSKHRDGVISFIKGHRSQREPVQGRIKDMIVYLLLLWGMVEEEEINKLEAVDRVNRLSIGKDLGGSDGDGH